ncbi:hypothetical protein C4559_04995 [Candidatus Microgenomates bacterium]|nr:MAG: hypothetical protein C4559_04995 [Candidatus Microgenomates bacterium]
MKTEKVVISFIAVAIGILVAGILFYLYQTTKTIPSSKTKTVTITPLSPTPQASIFLSLDKPKDEEVFDSRTVTIAGKTVKGAIVVISTYANDDVIIPASNGNFSTTATLDDGQNLIEITAIAPSGEEIKTTKVVTYSTENF